MKWISKDMHTKEVEEFLNDYIFEASTLTITHISSWDVLVTFFAVRKKEKL